MIKNQLYFYVFQSRNLIITGSSTKPATRIKQYKGTPNKIILGIKKIKDITEERRIQRRYPFYKYKIKGEQETFEYGIEIIEWARINLYPLPEIMIVKPNYVMKRSIAYKVRALIDKYYEDPYFDNEYIYNTLNAHTQTEQIAIRVAKSRYMRELNNNKNNIYI